jgi:hypothetical protein
MTETVEPVPARILPSPAAGPAWSPKWWVQGGELAAFVDKATALTATVDALCAIKNPSAQLRRQLIKTRGRLRVWRRRLEAKP